MSRRNKLDKILRTVERWYEEFIESEFFDKLTEQQKIDSESVITFVTEYMYSYYSASPYKWNAKNLVNCLLNILPAKVSAEISFFESIIPVLCAFIKFLSRKKVLQNADIIISAIRAIERDMIKNAKNPNMWGIAKRLAMVGMAFELDLSDEKKIKKLMTLYNLLHVKILP